MSLADRGEINCIAACLHFKEVNNKTVSVNITSLVLTNADFRKMYSPEENKQVNLKCLPLFIKCHYIY